MLALALVRCVPSPRSGALIRHVRGLSFLVVQGSTAAWRSCTTRAPRPARTSRSAIHSVALLRADPDRACVVLCPLSLASWRHSASSSLIQVLLLVGSLCGCGVQDRQLGQGAQHRYCMTASSLPVCPLEPECFLPTLRGCFNRVVAAAVCSASRAGAGDAHWRGQRQRCVLGPVLCPRELSASAVFWRNSLAEAELDGRRLTVLHFLLASPLQRTALCTRRCDGWRRSRSSAPSSPPFSTLMRLPVLLRRAGNLLLLEHCSVSCIVGLPSCGVIPASSRSALLFNFPHAERCTLAVLVRAGWA